VDGVALALSTPNGFKEAQAPYGDVISVLSRPHSWRPGREVSLPGVWFVGGDDTGHLVKNSAKDSSPHLARTMSEGAMHL